MHTAYVIFSKGLPSFRLERCSLSVAIVVRLLGLLIDVLDGPLDIIIVKKVKQFDLTVALLHHKIIEHFLTKFLGFRLLLKAEVIV